MRSNLLILLHILLTINLSGQITLENTYNYSGTYTHLKHSGDKFFLMDVGLNQCRIYNTDHSLWKTINLNVPSGNYLYDIRYVSENLFTTDNTLCLAYVYYYYDEINQYYTFNAKIIKENGTELLSIPGCQTLDIYNTENGAAKLLAYSYDYSLVLYTTITRVYNLPGQITGVDVIPGNQNETGFSPFPNPASSWITIPIRLPEGNPDGVVHLMDAAGKEIRTYNVSGMQPDITIPANDLPAGIYFSTTESGNVRSATQKFIIRK
jgi:hypothetical protein